MRHGNVAFARGVGTPNLCSATEPMPRLIIGSQKEDARLGFADVLAALGPRVASSAWTITKLHYISCDERDIPAFHHGEGSEVTGSELLSSLPTLLQVIDGEFRGSDSDGTKWVTVRAVDGSWWEVQSEDSS